MQKNAELIRVAYVILPRFAGLMKFPDKYVKKVRLFRSYKRMLLHALMERVHFPFFTEKALKVSANL